MIDVTTVTRNASQDALRDSDYLAIIDSLRTLFGYSWQRIADETGHNSKAWWALVAKGERTLDDVAKNALRRVTDGELPEQPPSVQDVTERMVHPDAEMVLVGTLDPGERVRRVLLMAADNVAVYANGEIAAKPLQGAVDAQHGETYPNGTQDATAPRKTAQEANRVQSYRPRLPVELRERVQASGVDVQTLIERGLAMEVGNE